MPPRCATAMLLLCQSWRYGHIVCRNEGRAACSNNSIFGDEFHNAKRLHQLCAGFGFEKPIQAVTIDELVLALQFALEEDCVAAARRLGFKLRGKRGEVQAAKLIDTFFRKEVRTGTWAAKCGIARLQNNCAPSPKKRQR